MLLGNSIKPSRGIFKWVILAGLIITNPQANSMEVSRSKDLGVYGEVFDIQEKNIVEVIIHKLSLMQKSGKLDEYNQKIQDRVKSQIERPKPVEGIVHTTTPRTFNYDPSITVTKDLKNHEGVVFHHAGSNVNPLHYKTMRSPLLFIDGDDHNHLTWAFFQLKRHPMAKVILINGIPLKIMEEIGIRIYFDQHGTITKKLGIKQVPAIVFQEGEVLKIQEVKGDTEELTDAKYAEVRLNAQPLIKNIDKK
jgi:conjugal transfer pilus assembly protein TraW